MTRITLDMKLYTRDEIEETDLLLKKLLTTLLSIMEKNLDTYMPDSHTFRKHSRLPLPTIWEPILKCLNVTEAVCLTFVSE